MAIHKIRQHTIMPDRTLATEHAETSADIVLFDYTQTNLHSENIQDAVHEVHTSLKDEISKMNWALSQEIHDFIPSKTKWHSDGSLTMTNALGKKVIKWVDNAVQTIFTKPDGTKLIKTTKWVEDGIETEVEEWNLEN